MTAPSTATAAQTAICLGWGLTVIAPNGMHDITPRAELLDAISDAQRINRTFHGAAAVAYRLEERGPWLDDATGDEFGIRYEWSDGRTEVEPRDSRADAEAGVGVRNFGAPGARARLVSRRAKLGPWLPFPVPPLPQPTGFIGAGTLPRPRRRWSWRG